MDRYQLWIIALVLVVVGLKLVDLYLKYIIK